MSGITIYHNPSCSKSRGALQILRDRGVEAAVVEYLKDAPSRSELERFLRLLDGPPSELVRQDKRFRELGLDASDYETPEAVVELLLAHPELMQRPVILRGERAVIARPPERVELLLEGGEA